MKKLALALVVSILLTPHAWAAQPSTSSSRKATHDFVYVPNPVLVWFPTVTNYYQAVQDLAYAGGTTDVVIYPYASPNAYIEFRRVAVDFFVYPQPEGFGYEGFAAADQATAFARRASIPADRKPRLIEFPDGQFGLIYLR